MTYNQFQENERRRNAMLADAQRLKEHNERISQTPEWKDAHIRELEKKIVELEKELEPHRKREAQQRIDNYGNKTCSGKLGCGCRDCRDL
jgi:ribosomal protein L17